VKQTWNSYESAVECVARGLARCIGYEFDGRPSSASGNLYGVDLDHVIGEDGALSPGAAEIAGKLNIYAEVSPSGSGLYLFVFAPGADIARHRKQDGFVEIYGEARYFTVTGNVHGSIKPIETRTAESRP
jgi:primase-polymerase (primpol)-like protein